MSELLNHVLEQAREKEPSRRQPEEGNERAQSQTADTISSRKVADCGSRLRTAGGAELRSDRVKGHVRVRADGLNGRQADDHDQSQHHGVFHRGWAIFRDQKTLHFQSEILHCSYSPGRRIE